MLLATTDTLPGAVYQVLGTVHSVVETHSVSVFGTAKHRAEDYNTALQLLAQSAAAIYRAEAISGLRATTMPGTLLLLGTAIKFLPTPPPLAS